MIHILIYSGSRSEFGIWLYFIDRLLADSYFKVSMCIGGELCNGFEVNKQLSKFISHNNFKVFNLANKNSSNDKNAPSEIIARDLTKLSELINKNNFDCLFVIGDRFEIFGPVLAAYFVKLPIFHLHGGEKTVGSLDDSVRHSISKLATYHLTANEQYSRRLQRLGENAKYIFNVGSISIDRLSTEIVNIKNINFKEKESLKESNYILVSFNPVSNESNDRNIFYIKNIIKVAEKCNKYKYVFTSANEDTQSFLINQEIRESSINSRNIFFVGNLGYERYYSLLIGAKLLMGNSSSGIIDAPFLRVPTLNIGSRQSGRLMSDSIVSVDCETNKIKKGIEFIEKSSFEFTSTYGYAGASSRIITILKGINLKENLLKDFIDYV